MPGVAIRRATDADLPGLAALLVEAVAGGASISFMAGCSPAEALAFWAGKLATPGLVVLFAHDGDTLVGTVSLATDQPPNQPHRADVQKLIVSSAARRQGIGRQLMAAVEAEARAQGRTTLVLDTVPDSAAALLYDQSGWTRIGSIADYALLPDGRMSATTIFAKWL
jgi:ribosomal protein S18 acetylase RimI-like enzyme